MYHTWICCGNGVFPGDSCIPGYMKPRRKGGFPGEPMYCAWVLCALVHGSPAETPISPRIHVSRYMDLRGKNRAIAGILVQIGLRNRQKRGFFNFLGVRPIKIGFPGGKSTQNWGDFALRRVSQGINALWPVGTRGKTGPGLRKL